VLPKIEEEEEGNRIMLGADIPVCLPDLTSSYTL
jgi:hypothetical protein